MTSLCVVLKLSGVLCVNILWCFLFTYLFYLILFYDEFLPREIKMGEKFANSITYRKPIIMLRRVAKLLCWRRLSHREKETKKGAASSEIYNVCGV